MPQAVLGGTSTFWRLWGDGMRRAVAIHCSLASSAAWAGVGERLAGTIALQAFDLPGHGRSGPWDGQSDIMDQTVAMALDLIGGDIVDLIGHSFGGVAALTLALARPAQVRSLVLYEPVLFAAAMARGIDAAALFAPFAAALEAGDRCAAARSFKALWGTGEDWAALPAPQREALVSRIHLVPAANAALFDDRGGLLAPGALARVDMPVLVLHGDRSPPVAAAIAEDLAARLPHAVIEVVAGAGHMGPVTHPATVAGAIARHLGG